MNKEQAKRWIEEIAFWANGGNLWFYSHSNEWIKYDKITPTFDTLDARAFIMEDKHFEARKAFALGEPIECANEGYENWDASLSPTWDLDYRYRPKQKQWYDKVSEDNTVLCWVWNNNSVCGKRPAEVVKYDDGVNRFMINDGCKWFHNAEPIKAEECWSDKNE